MHIEPTVNVWTIHFEYPRITVKVSMMLKKKTKKKKLTSYLS